MNGIQELSVSPASPTIPTAAAQIDKLPPETLAAIFVHLSKQQPDSPGRSSSYFVEDLLSITHVCRFWRQVAINAPELWTEITMKNPEAVEAFLERSGAVPLNVDLHLGPGTEPPCGILEAVAPHSHRFRRFSIFAPPEAHYDPFAAFTGPAPLLERLEINYPVDSPPRSLFGGQTPRLRELVISACGLWLQHQFGNLTSLHIKLCDFVLPRLGFLPFFDMLRHCPVLEEMFVWWNIWDVVRETPAQLLTVPLHRLRKLLLRSFRIENIEYLLRTFEFGANRTAVHLNEVDLGRNGEDSIARIQMVFPNDNSGRPSLVFSTKLELIFHTQPRTIILHAVGPGFSIRIDMRPDDYSQLDRVNFKFQDVFPSVKELWIRGSPRWVFDLDGLEHLSALEKVVLNGRGSKLARNLCQVLSPDHLGIMSCPLLSGIDCYGNASEIDQIYLLVNNRFHAGHQLEKLRVPSSFIPPPDHIGACVGDLGALDMPLRALYLHSMELPEFCFAKNHEWWKVWKSRSRLT